MERIVKNAAHLAVLAVLTLVSADHLQTRANTPAPKPVSSAQAHSPLPPEQELELLAAATWPEDEASALTILHCESRTGLDPNAWRTDWPDGGPYQINKESWERFFLERHGWTWEQITEDPVINTVAARIIYDQTGDWSAWSCSESLALAPAD